MAAAMEAVRNGRGPAIGYARFGGIQTYAGCSAGEASYRGSAAARARGTCRGQSHLCLKRFEQKDRDSAEGQRKAPLGQRRTRMLLVELLRENST